MDNDIHYKEGIKKKKKNQIRIMRERQSWAPRPRGQMRIALSNVEQVPYFPSMLETSSRAHLCDCQTNKTSNFSISFFESNYIIITLSWLKSRF